MQWPGRTIWDTRIQGVCGILSAKGDHGVELYFSATFAQVSFNPPRVIVNPNRMYAIEEAIRTRRRFAINVVPLSEKDNLIRLVCLRRRQTHKAELLGFDIGAPRQPNLIHASDHALEQWIVTALAKQGLPVDAKE